MELAIKSTLMLFGHLTSCMKLRRTYPFSATDERYRAFTEQGAAMAGIIRISYRTRMKARSN
jgi:hypothetical protein